MGVYDNDLHSASEYNIQEAYGYDNDYYSAQNVMIENAQNNMAFFEGIIRSDIQELAMRNSGYVEEEVSVFTENVLTDMLGKIKSLILKVWAKIKAIFKGFMARIDSIFMKSNKSFVNKYKSIIIKKDMTDFEVKWRKPKKNANTYEIDVGAFNPSDTDKHLNTMYWMGDSSTHPKKILEDWDEDKHMEETLNSTFTGLKVDSVSSYEKDFMDMVFDDEDVDDKIDINNVMTALLTMKDVKRESKKSGDSLNKALSRMVKMIEKDQNDFIKQNPLKFDKDDKYEGESIYHRAYSYKNTSGDYEASGDNISQGASETGPLVKGNQAKEFMKKGTVYTKDGTGTNNEYHTAYNLAKGKHSNIIDTNVTRKEMIERYSKAFQLVHKWAIIYQTCATKYTAVVMKCFKFHNSQLRRVFAKAVAYNRKKDESVMMEAMADLADYYEDVAEY